ncbi:MAG: UbiD family decarboxylase [bacterium]
MENIRKEILKAAEIKDDILKKHLFILGVLSDELFKISGKRPILLGGGAVEFYTFGGYTTGDIDIAFDNRSLFNKVAMDAGFTKEGRHWFHKELDVAVEIPAAILINETAPLFEVDILGKICLIIGIEDLIIDRLNAYVHWKSEGDGEWAKNLVHLNKEKINWSYLNQKALDNGVETALKDLK